MSHVEVGISERRLKQYGLTTPKFVTKEESWREWADNAYEQVRTYTFKPGVDDDLHRIKEQKRHNLLVAKLRLLRDGLESGHWVYVGDRRSVAFKPVTVSALGQDRLWRHGGKWLLMSATVISADEMLESLGWDDEKEWRLVKCPSTFPAENRKVIIWPVANMTYKEKEESWPKVVDAVGKVIDQHLGERVLVHSTSYELTRVIVEGISEIREIGGVGEAEDRIALAFGEVRNFRSPVFCADNNPSSSRPVFTYTNSADKDSALAAFLSSPGAILVAPSMDRGIDLPGDACRAQIICKVPFLNLKDKQVSTRLYGGGRAGKTWYAVNAIRTIVQMTGRAVRSENDWAVCYVLDSQFVSNLWGMNRRLFPEWWTAGLEWRRGGL